MTQATKVKVEAHHDREIRITRAFRAPRAKVFEAFTKPELVRQWLLGPGGWTMPVCEIDLRAGGAYRYVWRHPKKPEMGVSGTFREVKAPDRIVHTEKFDEAWYPGEAVITTGFHEKGGLTTVVMTILHESREARDLAIRSGMADGMDQSFATLAGLIE